MEHDLDTPGSRLTHDGVAAHVALSNVDPVRKVHKILTTPRTEVIEHVDAAPSVQQVIDEVRTDEPGATSDKNVPHWGSLACVRGWMGMLSGNRAARRRSPGEETMDRRFLMMVAAIAGLTMIVSLLVFTLESQTMGDESRGMHAVQYPNGGFLLVFAWLGGGFAAMLFLKMNERIGLSEQNCRLLSLIGFKLAGFFFLAVLIAGTRWDDGWDFGFWLAFIASVVGAFAIYLTFNPALAKRIADAAKEKMDDKADDKANADTPSDDA